MTTNHLGEYEFIMPRDRDYEIQVSYLPQDSLCYGSTHSLTHRSSNEMEVPEFRCERGTESITGSVLNLKGEPIAGARFHARKRVATLDWPVQIEHCKIRQVRAIRNDEFATRFLSIDCGLE